MYIYSIIVIHSWIDTVFFLLVIVISNTVKC